MISGFKQYAFGLVNISLSPNLKKLLGIDYQMFGLSKAVAEKQAEEAKGVESQLPLQTTVSD